LDLRPLRSTRIHRIGQKPELYPGSRKILELYNYIDIIKDTDNNKTNVSLEFKVNTFSRLCAIMQMYGQADWGTVSVNRWKTGCANLQQKMSPTIKKCSCRRTTKYKWEFCLKVTFVMHDQVWKTQNDGVSSALQLNHIARC